MKAIVYREHGPPDVLRYEDVDKPTLGNDEVLLEVRAAALNPLDWWLMTGIVGFGKPKPTIPGRDVAGRVEAVGSGVTRFKPGDAVFGVCRGACAEYARASPARLALKPENLTFEQAAAVPVAGLSALQGLRKGGIRAGQKVLVNGAAGGVGTFAVQIARSYGADVTGVCSTRNVELIRSIGADRVIDYTREDFTAGGHQYDLFLDCVANRSLSDCRRVLAPHGVCVMVGAPKKMQATVWRIMHAVVSSWFVRPKVVPLVAKDDSHQLTAMAELISAGKVTPVIDRTYELSEVAAAMRHLETWHARGKIVITLERDDSASRPPR
jgi:NADPH:quinone reductase-like Zn-dependent oxidoreductase